jgi:Carbohydrate binding module (family 6)
MSTRSQCVFALTALLLCAPIASSQELPRVFLDTTYAPPAVPPGNLIAVTSGGDFQAALNAAQPGDVIELQAGSTFTGNFVLPNKSGTGWIYIRSSAHASLPAPGTRVTPSQAGLMPKIVTNNAAPAIATAAAAHHYRFVGIEIASSASLTYNVISLEASPQTSTAQVPTDIVFDRCYIHGNATGNIRRGIGLNSARTAVVDSYLSQFHEVGADSQAIAGWNGPGPFKIVNNYLEGAGENVLFGGSDPGISGLVPEDIEIRRNHFFKPLSWKVGDPSYAGIHWSVKNIFELKNARRVLAEGNILENNWVDGQAGMAILFTVRNQDGNCSWCAVQDVTFQKNILRNTVGGFNITGTDDNYVSQQAARILIRDNVVHGVSGRTFQLLNVDSTGRPGGILDLIVDHNTTRAGSSVITLGDSTLADDRHQNPVIRNNIFERGTYGVFGGGVGEGTNALNTYTTNYTFAKNVIVRAPASLYPSQSCAPASTCYPATLDDVGFVDWANDDYRLAASSPYNDAGTDGKDIGADVDAVLTATAGAISGQWGGSSGPSQSPYTGTPFAAPGSFEAENFDLGGEGVAYHDAASGNAGGQYRTSEDVDIMTPASGTNASGYVVNNIQTGEWLEYTIDAAAAGSYLIELHVSSEMTGSAFHVEVDGADVTGSMTVPVTGWWGTYAWIGRTVTLTAGQHVLRVTSDQEYFNLDAIRIVSQTPYNGTASAAPGTWQAEDFDRGGEGVAYHDAGSGNAGGQYRTAEDVDILAPSSGSNASGYVVNNIQTGEWLEYTIDVSTTGTYTIELHASTEWTTSRFHIEIDGTDVTGPITVPSTGWWGTFAWLGKTGVTLAAGNHVLRVVAEEEYFNLDAIRITQ